MKEILILALNGLYLLLLGYLYFMVATIIISWIPGIRESKLYQIMEKISNFYMGRFHGIFVIGMIDLSPILGFVIYQLGLFGLGQLIGYLV